MCVCVCACVFVCHSAPVLPELIGGSADLTPSNLTLPTGCGDFQKATPGGRYIRFGVREHGMAAICNGIAAHGGLIPYCATFLNFTGYALGAFWHTALCWHASGARALPLCARLPLPWPRLPLPWPRLPLPWPSQTGL
eukprot:COSAG01_NODE_6964_length_3414_cov_11.188235_5_plen_138_part_00